MDEDFLKEIVDPKTFDEAQHKQMSSRISARTMPGEINSGI